MNSNEHELLDQVISHPSDMKFLWKLAGMEHDFSNDLTELHSTSIVAVPRCVDSLYGLNGLRWLRHLASTSAEHATTLDCKGFEGRKEDETTMKQ